MRLADTVKIALQALKSNTLRSFLTLLGIVIGAGAVVAMVAVGQGAKEAVEENISSLGTNVLFVMPGFVTQGGVRGGFGTVTRLMPDDAKAIKRECPAVRWVAPLVRTVAQVVYQHTNWSTAITGSDPDFAEVRNWPVVSGRYFSAQEIEGAAKVCLVGKIVAEQLFGSRDPVGAFIRIKKVPFTVIGVLAEKGQGTGFGGDQDDVILAPYTTVQRKIMGINHLNFIMASAASKESVESAEQQIEDLLTQRHRIGPREDRDFSIRSQAELAETATATSRVMILLLASVATVSLLVGGIGIMNIMLVSVTERTREIGIRMAVGAQETDILLQFLLEAVILSACGGVIGILLGCGGSLLVSAIAHWPVVISPWSIFLAFTFSALVGVFFGFYPARKASTLNPIEALRHE